MLTIPLGYGRRRTGRVGRGAGFDAFALRGSGSLWTLTGAAAAKTGARSALASVQIHNTMDGRHLVRAATVAQFRRDPEFAKRLEEDPEKSDSLYPAFPTELPGKEPAWGMSIDLNTCIGCNACVVACQAENNIPVVGKEQVAPRPRDALDPRSTAISRAGSRIRRCTSSRSPACTARRRPARSSAPSARPSTATRD